MWDAIGVAKISLLVLGMINLIVAFLLLVMPDLFKRLDKTLSRNFSTDKIDEALNKHRDIDSHFLKARKIIGVTGVILGVIFIYIYIMGR
jgi:hypothetical protein